MRRRFALAASVTLFLALPSTLAFADARSDARLHFRKGMQLITRGAYEDAIGELQRAYEILPHPNVLYNIGRAYIELGDIDAAIANFRRYLESDPPDRDDVNELVANLEERQRRQAAAAAAAAAAPSTASAPAPSGAPPTAGTPEAPAAPVPEAPRPLRPAPVIEAKTEVFEESVVTASRGAQSPLDAPNSTSIVTEQDIRLSGITKIPELLRRLAGVDILQATGSQTEVSIRGFNQRLSNKVLVLINGRSVYVDLLGATLWGLLSIGVEDIERIEVVRGPGSALYGADAIGGVINIITKRPGEGGSGVRIGAGDHETLHGSVWASGRTAQFGWRFAGGYDALPRWSRDVAPGRVDATVADVDPSVSQRTARLDLRGSRRLSKDVTVGLGGSLVNGSIEILGIGPVNNVVLPDTLVSDITATLESPHFQVRAFWNHYNVRNQQNNVGYLGQSRLPAAARVDIADAEVQYVDSFPIGALTNKFNLGLSYRFKSVDWDFLDTYRVEHHGATFLHDELRVSSAVSVVGDVRLDYVPFLQRVVPSPRGSVLVHPSARSTVRGVVATAFRKPTFLESYLQLAIPLSVAGAGSFAGNWQAVADASRVREERGFTAELGYMNQESDYFTFDSAIFYNRLEGLIQLAPNRLVSLGDNATGIGGLDPNARLYPVSFTQFANACQSFELAGGEAGVRVFPVEGLDLYANYTLNVVRQNNSGCSAAELALLVNEQRTSEHKINGGLQVRTRFGLDGSVDVHYVSPQVWAEQVVNTERQRLEYTAYPLNEYVLLNAKLGYRFWGDSTEVSLMTFNLLGLRHREHPFGQVVDRRVMALASYRF